jgi:hypothetical protein
MLLADWYSRKDLARASPALLVKLRYLRLQVRCRVVIR